jgi:hypothetical protein
VFFISGNLGFGVTSYVLFSEAVGASLVTKKLALFVVSLVSIIAAVSKLNVNNM